MKQLLKWTAIAAAAIAAMFMTVSCVKGEKFADESLFKAPGVYGYLDPIASDDNPDTKATVNPATMKLGFEVGDNINIWSSIGTLVIYSVEEITAGGGASFDGGGFSLTDGETYYSSFPLISSFKDKLRSLTTSYEGQVQTADGDPSHVADFSYTYASSLCTNGNASFAYHYLCRWLRFQLTLPKTMVVTELTVTADSEVFALDGKVDVTTGIFTPGKMSDTMTLKFNNVRVSDGVLNAFMAHAPYEACNIVVSVKDKDGNVYSTPVIAQAAATNLGKYRTITQTLTEDSSAADAVARIGLVNYPTLAAALAAVPYSAATPTTITMIGDESITGVSEIGIGSDQNIILDLNGRTISQFVLSNSGTLTIKDSSDSAKDGNGSGKMIVDSAQSAAAVFDYLIANTGVLNIESGYLEMEGSAQSAVVLNLSGSNTSITGGKLKNNTNGANVVKMCLSSTTTDNILIVGGTAVFEGNTGIYVEYADGNANRGDLNITGGTFNTTDRAVFSTNYGDGTAYNASGLSLNISGGNFGGRGVAINAFRPLRSLSVSGGHFASFTVQTAGGIKFITGGEFESVTEMIRLHFPAQTPIADGYKAVYEDDLYIVVPESDPRPAVSIFPDNMIAYKWEGGSWYSCDFYTPFEGPNPILCADEYIALVMDINLTRDVTYIQSSDWCTPIFQGGTFYLRFGDFDIHLNGYAFPLPTGVSVKTDRQTDIFTALEPGGIVTVTEISEGEYHYLYSVTVPSGGVAAIGLVAYPSLAEAIEAVPADGTPTTITILQDVELVETSATSSGRVGINIPASKNVILDLNGHTISHVGLFTGYSRLIENQGVLTLMDSSDTDCNGTGTGKLIVDSREPGTNTANYYSSDVIANHGFLTILSGLYEMYYARLSSYVLFNDFTASASLSGGKLYHNISTGRVVQMNLSSSSVEECSTLEISGTAVLEGRNAVYMDSSNGTYHVAVLSISGGALNSTAAAVYCIGGNVSHISVDITGGVFGGTGLALNAETAYYELNVSGGHFADFIVGQKGGTKFVSGGEFESIDHLWDWRFPSESVIADGFKVVYDSSDRLYKVVRNSDPRPDANPYPANRIYYYWIDSGSIIDFYDPFVGDGNWILVDGESIILVEDITLNKDVTWIEEADWCTPIFQGGTFYLKFGEFDINLNGYAFPLPTGVSVKTDRQTDIFTALAEGATVTVTEISEEEYHYVYSVTQ